MGKTKESERLRVKEYRKNNREHVNTLARLRYKNNPIKRKKKKVDRILDFSPRPHCKLYYKHCEGCGAIFTTSHSNAKACKPTHTLKAKLSRKHRKYKKPISRFYKEELNLIYINKPVGMEVDHIIPINGENVSGLHVPWNLQYLTPEANNKKSNKT